jgi:hypothetical protein
MFSRSEDSLNAFLPPAADRRQRASSFLPSPSPPPSEDEHKKRYQYKFYAKRKTMDDQIISRGEERAFVGFFGEHQKNAERILFLFFFFLVIKNVV